MVQKRERREGVRYCRRSIQQTVAALRRSFNDLGKPPEVHHLSKPHHWCGSDAAGHYYKMRKGLDQLEMFVRDRRAKYYNFRNCTQVMSELGQTAFAFGLYVEAMKCYRRGEHMGR